MGESRAPAIDSLKKVATSEHDLSKVTAPHIALNSGEIQRISGNTVMAMQAIPVTGAEESRLPDIKFVYGEAKTLVAWQKRTRRKMT